MSQPAVPPPSSSAAPMRELTLRGILLGGLITLLFTAANVYLGLKVGITFATSIPAAVISMAVLRFVRGSTILENNIVQTIASAAGTLAAIIFVLPGLIMIGWWQGFPYWTTVAVCAIGGTLGVMFSVPLRRALVTGSDLPYPEGVAAAEVLKVGSGSIGGAEENAKGLAAIVAGSIASAGFALLAAMKLAAGELATAFRLGGGAASGASTSLSMALIGVGHLVGMTVGIAMLIGMLTVVGGAGPGADLDAGRRRGRRGDGEQRVPQPGPLHRRRHDRRRRGLDPAQDHRPDRRRASARRWPRLRPAPAARRWSSPSATCRSASSAARSWPRWSRSPGCCGGSSPAARSPPTRRS